MIKCKKRQPLPTVTAKSFFDIAPRSLTIIAYLRPFVKTLVACYTLFVFSGGYKGQAQTITRGDFYFMDFYKILKSLTKDNRLTFGDILVMSVIVTHAQYATDKTIEISFSDIHAEFERLSDKTIRRSLQRLSELEYIETIKQTAPKPNKYKVLIEVGQVQAKPIYQKKPSNKIQSSDDFITEAKRVIAKNPFLQ